MLDSALQGTPNLLTASCLLVLGTTAALSQPTGELSGVVRDPMGGVLPGVEVSVTSVSGVSPRSSLTDAEGYEVDALPQGATRSRPRSAGFNRRPATSRSFAVAPRWTWCFPSPRSSKG